MTRRNYYEALIEIGSSLQENENAISSGETPCVTLKSSPTIPPGSAPTPNSSVKTWSICRKPTKPPWS